MTASQAIAKIDRAATELGFHDEPEATIAEASRYTGKLYDALNEEWLRGLISHEEYAEISVSLLNVYAAARVRFAVFQILERIS